jgi:hypothetical protein
MLCTLATILLQKFSIQVMMELDSQIVPTSLYVSIRGCCGTDRVTSTFLRQADIEEHVLHQTMYKTHSSHQLFFFLHKLAILDSNGIPRKKN